jgi:hypothetical protein
MAPGRSLAHPASQRARSIRGRHTQSAGGGTAIVAKEQTTGGMRMSVARGVRRASWQGRGLTQNAWHERGAEDEVALLTEKAIMVGEA